MAELLRFYKGMLATLAGAAVALVLLDHAWLTATLVNYGNLTPAAAKTAAAFVTSKRFVVGLLVVGEWLIRKWLWAIVRPDLNFRGKWHGVSEYHEAYIQQPPAMPEPVEHEVRFNQDCISFEMQPTKAKKYARWGALAIELAEKKSIHYAYWVDYDGKSGFPSDAIGYEELSVTDTGWFGRPIELSGKFYQCAKGEGPVYSGTVTFKRR